MGIHSNPHSAVAVPSALLKTPLTVQERLEAHLRLLQALQTSQDPDQIIQLFFRHIQPLVNISGIRFMFKQNRADIRCGKNAPHHCDYRLTTEDGYLGEIIFNRNKRFNESELASLESLLSSLVYPLRNALNYETALRLSLHDPLTGLGNRAALDTALHRELQLAERHHLELSLLMIDIDHFKHINDAYGHARGDEVLKAIAQTIQSACRDSDISFRFGGEEFVVLLRKTNASGARMIAERIRKQITSLCLDSAGSKIHPTVSIGIGTHATGQRENIRDMFERADKALYQAKALGRNRTTYLAS